MTIADADALLDRLDAQARINGPYPACGLPIWGELSRRDELRRVVMEWVETHVQDGRCG